MSITSGVGSSGISSIRGGSIGSVGSASSSTWSNSASSLARHEVSCLRASSSMGAKTGASDNSCLMSPPTPSGSASASAPSDSSVSHKKIVVKAPLPSCHSGIPSGTTSNPAARSASSIACSISVVDVVSNLPIRCAGASFGLNPGSSSCMHCVTQAKSRAIGPTLSKLGASGHTPFVEMRPNVVFSPETPQHADGIRIEPPVSVPMAISASPVATATADPLDDPPGMSALSSGFAGVPNHGLTPNGRTASSWRLLLPMRRAPAARNPARHAASSAAGLATRSTAREPAVVGMPSTSSRSFTATRGPVPEPSSIVIHVDMRGNLSLRCRLSRLGAQLGPRERAQIFRLDLLIAGQLELRLVDEQHAPRDLVRGEPPAKEATHVLLVDARAVLGNRNDDHYLA